MQTHELVALLSARIKSLKTEKILSVVRISNRLLPHLHHFTTKSGVFIAFSSPCKLTNKTQILLCVASVHTQETSQTVFTSTAHGSEFE